jgi:hypothetical protein
MARSLDRDKLLAAFDEIGRAAIAASTQLEIAVYGGSALMLASNFRFNTEDVDISAIQRPWPKWLEETVDRLAQLNGWDKDWFNDGVAFHLSARADRAGDHFEFGTFPQEGETPGLIVYVPTASYMLALKLKAMRINDPGRGEQERLDILNLMRVLGIQTVDEVIAVLTRYFPVSGASAESKGSC